MENNYAPGAPRGSFRPAIVMPLPDHDFDPTESTIPWQILHLRGWTVNFSTEKGNVGEADPIRLRGPLPGLVSASSKVRAAYQEMGATYEFQHPIPYTEIDIAHYQAILLPGGDGPRMRQYLDNEPLREKVLGFWQQDKLIGAICHGILVAARTIDPRTGRSILHGRKVTAIPKTLDRTAYKLDSWFTKHGYIMYSKCVADEVQASLASPSDLLPGASWFTPYVVTDGNLVTARWFAEAQPFGAQFAAVLEKKEMA